MTSLVTLIERLEMATGPSRDLDGQIWKIADPEAFERNCGFRGMKYAGHVHTPAEKKAHVLNAAAKFSPAYTKSLDTALTLVPEDRVWSVSKIVRAEGYVAVLDNDGKSHKGSTPALALCIASLRARLP